MTQAKSLSHHTLETIVNRAQLQEVYGINGGAFKTLESPFGKVGELRVFQGETIAKLVYISMTVAQFGLDSHMIFAFTPPTSAVPHFTLDSVMNGEDNFAFHLDLIPRLDLGANLDYLFNVFSGLDAHFEATSKIEGLIPARLGPTQYAIMSPWMLAYRANTSAFTAITDPVNAYLEHWFTLLENGVGDLHFDEETLAERDRLNRAAIFNPKVDRVWAQVDRLLGADTSAFLQSVLKNQSVESLDGVSS